MIIYKNSFVFKRLLLSEQNYRTISVNEWKIKVCFGLLKMKKQNRESKGKKHILRRCSCTSLIHFDNEQEICTPGSDTSNIQIQKVHHHTPTVGMKERV